MAKKIRISGYIGLDTTTAAILQQLKDAAGEDIDALIASVGGSVYEGIEIFNAIKDYKKEFPGAAIYVAIKGVAASMASYITMVAAYVGGISAAEDNAIMMIHNPWNGMMGDYREMQKNADFLKGLTALMGKAYVRQTGKSAEEIGAIMDAETWLFGQQIKDAGFVDEMIPASDDEPQTDAASAIAAAKVQYQQAQARAKELRPDPEKVAAVMRQVLPASSTTDPTKSNISVPPVVDGPKNTPARGKAGMVVKDLKELQTEHPEIYADAVAAGVKKEQDRVKALSDMKKDKRFEKIAAVQSVLDECIATGKSKDEANTLIMATLASPAVQAEIESPGPIATGSVDTPTGEKPNGAAGKADEKPAWKPGQAEEV